MFILGELQGLNLMLLWQQGVEKADQMGFVCLLTEYLLEAKVGEQVDVFFFHWCRVTLAASPPHSGLFSPCFQARHEKKEYTRFTAYARGKYKKNSVGQRIPVLGYEQAINFFYSRDAFSKKISLLLWK